MNLKVDSINKLKITTHSYVSDSGLCPLLVTSRPPGRHMCDLPSWSFLSNFLASKNPCLPQELILRQEMTIIHINNYTSTTHTYFRQSRIAIHGLLFPIPETQRFISPLGKQDSAKENTDICLDKSANTGSFKRTKQPLFEVPGERAILQISHNIQPYLLNDQFLKVA